MLRLFYFSLSRLSDAAAFYGYFRGYDSTRAQQAPRVFAVLGSRSTNDK